MNMDKNILFEDRFPRSNKYDADWLMSNYMGPNPLQLTEWLFEELELPKGARVLDLGCGKAVTSIFMAKEFGVRVWASDLWVPADENWKRVQEANLEDAVFPIQVECHALPFPAGFFDAIVSIDAYHFFGTDDLYLGYLSRFVRPGGTLGVVMPGLMRPIDGSPPKHLTEPQSNGAPFWEDECISFHTKEWWRNLWELSNKVDVLLADTLEDGWRYWRDFAIAVDQAGKSPFPSEAGALDKDAGEYMGFVRMIAKPKPGVELANLYEPNMAANLGE